MLQSLLYVSAIVCANLAVARFGPVAMPVIAFVLIGLDLTLRDRLHDHWQGRLLWLRMCSLIAIAGGVSYIANPASGVIAAASVAAFCLASLADAAAYQLLGARTWAVRVNGSNVVGAAVDSILFPLLAFGAVPPAIVLAQLVAKVAGGMLWAFVIARLGRAPSAA